MQTQPQIELRMSAKPEYLTVARQAVLQAAKLAGICQEESDSMALAIVEALSNVIRHSYGGPCEQRIIIRIQPLAQVEGQDQGLEITVRDFGKHVDPACIQGRDLEDVRPGGLGVHIIRSVMDEVEYHCVPEGGMQLRMVKFLHKNESKPDPL